MLGGRPTATYARLLQLLHVMVVLPVTKIDFFSIILLRGEVVREYTRHVETSTVAVRRKKHMFGTLVKVARRLGVPVTWLRTAAGISLGCIYSVQGVQGTGPDLK
jgi:hypothetical protein